MNRNLSSIVMLRIIAVVFVGSSAACGDDNPALSGTDASVDVMLEHDQITTGTDAMSTPDQTQPPEDQTAPSDSGSDGEDTSDVNPIVHPVLSPFPAVSQCAPACETSSDCTKEPAGPGAFGPEEWRCLQGGCVYAGCSSDDSCKESLGKSLDVTCNTKISPPSCDFLCDGNENCGFSSDPDGGALGDDNYTCDEQTCRYDGCKGDEECAISYLSFPQNYHCQPFEQGPPRCVPTCTTADDCYLADPPGGAYGLDNWECTQGACRWLGCFSDEECDISTPGTSKRVCLPPR